MKCVDCGKDFKPTPSKRELHVTLANPGHIAVTGEVSECPHCKQHYTDEKEALRLMRAFEASRLAKKQHPIKKELYGECIFHGRKLRV